MCGFIRKAPAGRGGYRFLGEHYLTRDAREELSPVEYVHIVQEIVEAVEREGDVCKIQKFRSVDGDREVWLVDDVTHWTMMMDYEFEPLSAKARLASISR
ncbi:MAG: hypothetical protein AAF194_03565 [Pseudomonadota bacterium]